MSADHRTSADLREYLDAIDVCYFGGALDDLSVSIKWMRTQEQVTRVGQYLPGARKIEIARVLACPEVPMAYVLHVIHHEACHAIVSLEHDAAFHAAASRFALTHEAWEWERRNLPWPTPPRGLR